MANFGGPNDFYTSGDNSYNFDMPEFDQELNFQNFENTPTSVPPNFDLNYPNTNNSGMSSFYDPNAYAPNPYEQDDKGFKAGAGNTGNEFEDEPPLLEELGINPNHIFQKTLAVLNPMRGADQQILQDSEMINFQNFENTPTSVPPNFDLNYPNTNNSGMSSFYDPNAYAPNPYEQDDKGFKAGAGNTGNEFEDEPPLLEELGINPNHIFQKTLAVLNPMRGADQQILQDTDMAGPLVFCLALGGFLLLSGKVTFSYIYGIGVMGSIAFYCLLSLMASQANVTFGAVVSVLGYCLLPMVVLSGVNVLITIQGTIGLIVAGVCIFWCSLSASKLFVTAYSMDHQQVLIAYPCALLYGVFALITIF